MSQPYQSPEALDDSGVSPNPIDKAICTLLTLFQPRVIPPTVLIVEDTAADAKVVIETLKQCGFHIAQVTSSEDAEAYLQHLTPALIVLDVVLPGESGFELCRRLKINPTTQSIPIIMCSTKSSEIDHYWGLKQGASVYLTKPVEPFALRRAAKMLVPELPLQSPAPSHPSHPLPQDSQPC
jgi:two-component system, chemotaxis family, response regulator PixH